MTTDDGQPDYIAFNAEIDQAVEQAIEKGEPCLISKLGIALGPKLRAVKAATDLTLGQYIETRLSDRYILVDIKNNTKAIWPRGTPYVRSHQEDSGKTITRSTTPRFQPDLWQAFALPIRQGRRFYDPTTDTVFGSEEEPQEGWIEIPKSRIRSPGATYNVKEIYTNIKAWITENNLDASRFYAPATPSSKNEASASVLDLMINALDKRQLQNITLPMDVIAALVRARL